MIYLELEDILVIRDRLSEAHADRFEIMSPHGLLSALAAPRRSAFGAEAFPTLSDKAGALVYALIQNHPFWDGNKRIATGALQLFLARNRAGLAADAPAIKSFTSAIARGALRDRDLVAWVSDHIEDEA